MRNALADLPPLSSTTLHEFILQLNRHLDKNYPLSHPLFFDPVTPESLDLYPVGQHEEAYGVLCQYFGYWSNYIDALIQEYFSLQDNKDQYQFVLVLPLGQTLKFEGFGNRLGQVQLSALINALAELYAYFNYQHKLVNAALIDFGATSGLDRDMKQVKDYLSGSGY